MQPRSCARAASRSTSPGSGAPSSVTSRPCALPRWPEASARLRGGLALQLVEQSLVLRLKALKRRALAGLGHVAPEAVTRLQRLALQAEADLGSEIDIGRTEPVAQDVRPRL